MRRLIPDAGDERLEDLYLDLEIPEGTERPHVYLDMISSADGAASAGGRTESLAGEADKIAFSRLRETCDAILVGARTVSVEDYGPPRPTPQAQARRRERGLATIPTIVVVTARLSLDPGARFFADPTRRPTLLVPEDVDPARLAAFADRADVVTAGIGLVDLDLGLQRVREQGVTRLLCEGGPTLNALLLAGGLVDELFLTVAPMLVGTDALRIVDGSVGGAPVPMELVEAREHGSELLLRYRVRR